MTAKRPAANLRRARDGRPLVPHAPDRHPVLIGVDRNAAMGCFDLVIQIGNFTTDAAARAYADRLLAERVFADLRRLRD